jgi:hypothetical protein
MWDDFAKHFMDSFSKVNDDRVFVVVKRGRIKPAHGTRNLSYHSVIEFPFVT